jgi:Ca2+-binding RTX toxin-like protein
VLSGGQGSDRLTGGQGADVFVFAASGGRDIVTDFELGLDRIRLEGITVQGLEHFDLDGNGVLDAVLRFDTGSVVLMNTGQVDDWTGLVA